MSERLTGALADLVITEGLGPDAFVWYSRRGNQRGYRAVTRSRPIGEGTFHRWWERCLADASVRYRSPHTARHTFATRWLRRRGRMETLWQAMGHASIATTVDLYGHLDVSDVARDLALVEAGNGINPPESEGR
jgi:integrase